MVTLLPIIFEAMLDVPRTVNHAIAEHDLEFRLQLGKSGLTPELPASEPYMDWVQANFELQFLKKMERLIETLERNLTKRNLKDRVDWEIGIKAINYKEPLEGQIIDRIEAEQFRLQGRVKQELDRRRQQAIGVQSYRWQTREDERVRIDHAHNNGKQFRWDTPPSTGHPGEAYGCRCIAEPNLGDLGEPRVEPVEVAFLKILVQEAGKIISRRGTQVNKIPKKTPSPSLNNTKTWPKPPTKGKLKEGNPSRKKPSERGEKSLYDKEGGEWRYSPEDKYHNPHWDYKSPGKNQKWENIPIDDLPPKK